MLLDLMESQFNYLENGNYNSAYKTEVEINEIMNRKLFSRVLGL